MLGADGKVYAFGDARRLGSAPGSAVAIAPRAGGSGYWTVDAAGDVSHFGTAAGHGGHPALRFGETVSTISATPSGNGYWLFTNRGRAFPFGDAHFFGDMSRIAFNAPFRGSMGAVRLNKPVAGLVAFGTGYLMVANDGGVFDFSTKAFAGSLADAPPTAPIVDIAAA